MAATSKSPPSYQVSGRTLEIDRTPRTHATTQSGRASYLARPPPAHDPSSDARSWSRQTEDALDAYKQLGEERRPETNQTTGISYNSTVGQERDYEKSFEEKTGFQVTNYRLDSGTTDVRVVGQKQLSEKSASGYYVTYIEAAELENGSDDQTPGARTSPPKNHRMTKMIVKEDIEFFEALLDGHDPPTTMGETRAFVRDETETHRHSQEVKDREADERRREEAQAAKADTDFFMMLMGKG